MIKHYRKQQVLYFYLPVLLLMLVNFAMFILFVFKLIQHKKTTFGARQSRRLESRTGIYSRVTQNAFISCNGYLWGRWRVGKGGCRR